MIEIADQPAWPTTLRSILRDGRVQGTDGSVWVYRSVPMSPVVDSRTPLESLQASEPMFAMYEELASMANINVTRRAMSKGSYRQVHMLLVNVPQLFLPSPAHPLSSHLRDQFPTTAIDRRLLLFGVRLVDKIGGTGGLREAIDSVVETVLVGQTPLSDFDWDFERVSNAMDRSGLTRASSDDLRLANAWWNHGAYPDTPMLVHAEHMHVFESVDSVRMASQAGVSDCSTWTPETVPGQHAVTFASVQDLDLQFVEPTSPAASWAADLIDAGALVVSVRGSVEPGTVTRDELRRQRKRFIDDINERSRQGKMERAEQEEMLGLLAGVEQLYATGGSPPPTLTAASILVGFNGQVRDINQKLPAGSPPKLSLMSYRQPGAMTETMLCSSARANPNLHDLPIQTVACAGLGSLSFVGDAEGALLGFTERDRQPAYLSPTAASTADGLPMMLVAGATGSGKTMVLLSTADQFARMNRPVVIVDPKQDSDHSAVVLATGGQVASLDQLVTADGIFDPMRFSSTREVGVELAASMLMSINPWGSEKNNMEVPITHALAYGSDKGATCIGQALATAKRDLAESMPKGMIERVENLASSSPMFRACVGVNPQGQGLRTAEGITLIKVGQAHLDLPEPGTAPETMSITQRVALALVRMMVFGSAMALTGRGGSVMLDEAWVFLGAGKSEVERLGRLARSQQVLPIMFTQRVSDAVDAGLTGYISRGLILPIEDTGEAAKACELFKLEPTRERMGRITARATMGGTSAQNVAPNWNSMRALRDPVTKQVMRGSVAIYADLSGRAIPCEMTIPPDFLALASTNPDDIRRRLAAEQSRKDALRAHQADVDALGVGRSGGEEILDRVF